MNDDFIWEDSPHPLSDEGLALLEPKQRQARINRSRNYIRYQLSRNKFIGPTHPRLTNEERILIGLYNDQLEAIRNLKMVLFLNFYKNNPAVGCTLVRKDRKVSNGDKFIFNETID